MNRCLIADGARSLQRAERGNAATRQRGNICLVGG